MVRSSTSWSRNVTQSGCTGQKGDSASVWASDAPASSAVKVASTEGPIVAS
ncbi:Uncharacterised protein [Mycobacteroides abscessus subsp. abscessus]|nr:Uncharacterised protein [Mycobacteroides abscessus subsp. abscessus]